MSFFNASTHLILYYVFKNRGPGWKVSDLESNRIIGQNQADMAIKLYNDHSSNIMSVGGPIDYRQKYWDISTVVIQRENGTTASLCPPAMVNSNTILNYAMFFFPIHI